MARKDFQIARQGERTNAAGKPVSNKLLLSIPDSEYHAIRPGCFRCQDILAHQLKFQI